MKKTWFAFFVLGLCILSAAFLYGCGNATGGGGGGGGGGSTGFYTLTLAVSTEIPTSEPCGYIDVSPSTEGYVYPAGTEVTLDAISTSDSYMFSSWEGSISGETTPILITVDGNKDILARYKIKPLGTTYPFNFTVSPEPSYGDVAQPGTSPYPAGTVILITAEAYTGYIFDHWTGDLSGSSNPTKITINGPKNVKPVFRPIKKYALTLAASPAGYGTVGQSGTSPYDEGTVVTVTATPSGLNAFDHWSGDLSGSANPATITMNGTKDVTAVFKAPEIVPDNTYDGTYTGQFVYVRYENGIESDDTPEPDPDYDPDEGPDTWEAVSHAINITVTFQHFLTLYPGTASGEIWEMITYAKCSEPTFGAVGGFNPTYGTCYALLPEVIPTSPSNPSIGGEQIFLAFPNGYITTNNNPGALHVSGDGRTLSNTLSNPDERWDGYTTGSPTFEWGSVPPGGDAIKFQSWILNKTD